MFIVCIRTAILYILVVIVMRLMGKRQIGELQPYEFVITIMISDLASLPMQDSRLPLLLGIIPILTLLLLKILLSQLQLKCQFARRVVEGEPSILIYKSKINYNALKSQQINIDELMEEMRLSGYFNLDDITYAILETNGHISFFPSEPSSSNGTQSSNQNSNTELYLPKILVSDGKINKNPLTKIDKDKDWIVNVLNKHGIDDVKKVLIAMYDTSGKFKYQLFDKYEKKEKKK
ncbi:MAG: DUF421 domain-containing protein [Clostridium baratii]|uniref:YetF C-terminal domain-containing protein n=1 Tax=Clostridium baratii str. Sullivan TaxID=1415775 RepID=A0A0A7FVX8_9CLOT|nr:YetF domain-containing protein [Clostridium baratii]AIY83100.1 hypothetical protein U729_397 [Clostridium baratii str. Sullivan]MBS6007708.1 DUF421 domain-containing protein [Clostridium baratii]MDU1054500.1 DUF421 domain-containing protein [Clostridium baratii]MDU4911522.1 DUF421 domain-containing protein [Clostridium baratii]CUP58399.1 Protein of uncharacterised function (DUF421) [Clostridium baratii]